MDVLVAAAIHDAKNSLNALGVWLEEARRDYARHHTDARSPALERALAIAGHLSGDLVKLLALYRADTGSLRLTIEDHDLADFLEEAADEFRRICPDERGIEFEVQLDAARAVGEWAFDAYQVRFVLLDALRNAERHARTRIRMSAARGVAQEVVICIEDDGVGYSADWLSAQGATGAVTDVTGRSSPETAMGSTGSGLGLGFARLIAQRHATPDGRTGRLELANEGLDAGGSRGGRGGRFTLVLP
jgi:signal transduction histidine kinase